MTVKISRYEYQYQKNISSFRWRYQSPKYLALSTFKCVTMRNVKKLSILRQSVSSSNVRTKQRKSSQESGILESWSCPFQTTHTILYAKKNARFIHPKNWIYFVRNAIHIYTKCCTLQDHQRHTFVDFEAIYTDNSEKCHQKIFNISQYFLPDSQILKE